MAYLLLIGGSLCQFFQRQLDARHPQRKFLRDPRLFEITPLRLDIFLG